MSVVYLVDRRSEALTKFQAAQNRLHRHVMFTAIRTPMTSKENAETLEVYKQQAEECFNQALACNSDVEGLLNDRGLDCLPSPELPTMGATQAWGARIKARWVNLEKRVEEALSEGQRSGESIDSPVSLDLSRMEVKIEAEAQIVEELGPVQDHLGVEEEEAEVTGVPGSNPSCSLDHQSLRHGSHPLTSFTQVSIAPRTAPLQKKPLNQKEETALGWSFSYGLGRSQDEVKMNWQMLQEELMKMKAPKFFRASSSVERVKTLTTDLEEPVEAPSSWAEPFEERSIRRGFLSNRKPFKQISKVHAISFIDF